MALATGRKGRAKQSMVIEHQVSPDEFLRLLKSFVSVSRGQLTEEENQRAKQLVDQIADTAEVKESSDFRCLAVAVGFLLQFFVEEVNAKTKEDREVKPLQMKFKETYQ